MRVLLAGATGAIGVPLVCDLLAGGHQVYGLTRTPGNAGRLEAQGVQPVVADAVDRDALLAAVRGLRADAVIHQLTDLKRLPMRHRDLVRTNAPARRARPTCWRQRRRPERGDLLPSPSSAATAMATTAQSC